MSRRSLVVVLAALAVPATAGTYDLAVQQSAAVCIAVADAHYRIAAPNEFADYTVRLDRTAAAPDLRIQFTHSIDDADFVMVADELADAGCQRSLSRVKTVRINANASTPDLIVGFVSDAAPADYRIYLRAGSVAPEAALVLYAAARISMRRPVP